MNATRKPNAETPQEELARLLKQRKEAEAWMLAVIDKRIAELRKILEKRNL
jgi:hypothetical protein